MYQGLSHEDLNRWLCNVRLGCKMRRIPRQQWADVAIYFMNGDLKVVMAGLKSHMEKSGSPTWEWEAFQKELTKICGALTAPTSYLIYHLNAGFDFSRRST